jgi:hypothetical protein
MLQTQMHCMVLGSTHSSQLKNTELLFLSCIIAVNYSYFPIKIPIFSDKKVLSSNEIFKCNCLQYKRNPSVPKNTIFVMKKWPIIIYIKITIFKIIVSFFRYRLLSSTQYPSWVSKPLQYDDSSLPNNTAF